LIVILLLLALVCRGKKGQNKEQDWIDRLEELDAIIEDE